jgi:hypothetical protein
MANLIDDHNDRLGGALADDGGAEGARDTLNEKSGAIRELNVKVEAGEAEAPPSADYVLAVLEVALLVRAVRERIKRLHRGDMDIRNAFGVGTVMDISSDKSLLHAVSLVNAGSALYPEVAARFPEELMLASAAHEATLLQAVAAGLPVGQQPNPDVARRKAVQVEVQNLVDRVIAAVAVRCWRTPEVLAVFKSALPSTSPPKK